MHPWAVVDPVLEHDLELREVADRLMTIVHSGWTDVPEMRPLDPKVWAFLSRHRVATIIPLEACVADQRNEFAERLRNIQALQMRIEATAREVCALLADVGIETRVLKGLASAFLDYPRPELRHTGDVDIAIRPAQVADAVRQLETHHGWRAKPAPDRSPHTYKGVTLLGPRNMELDIHDRLFVRTRPSELLFDLPAEPATSGLVVLTAEARLVNAAGGFILTPVAHRRLSGLFDVTRLIDARSVDIEVARRLAGAMRVEGLVADTLRAEARLNERSGESYASWASSGWLDRRTRFVRRRSLVFEHMVRLRNVPGSAIPRYLPIWLTPNAKDRSRLAKALQRRWKRG